MVCPPMRLARIEPSRRVEPSPAHLPLRQALAESRLELPPGGLPPDRRRLRVDLFLGDDHPPPPSRAANPVRFGRHCQVRPVPRRLGVLAELPSTREGAHGRRREQRGTRSHRSSRFEASYLQSRSRRTCNSSSTSSRRSCATGCRAPFWAVFMARAIWLRLLPIRERW